MSGIGRPHVSCTIGVAVSCAVQATVVGTIVESVCTVVCSIVWPIVCTVVCTVVWPIVCTIVWPIVWATICGIASRGRVAHSLMLGQLYFQRVVYWVLIVECPLTIPIVWAYSTESKSAVKELL